MAERRVYLKFIAETQQWKRAMSRLQRDLAALRRRLDAFGNAARTGAVAVGAAFGAALRVFVPVERAITRAGAAMGKTGAALKPLREEIKKVGRESEASTRDVARAAEEYGRAGRTMVETMALLKPTADLAVIGNLDVAEAADKVTKTLKAFRLPAESATAVIDGMVVAMENSTAGMNDLAQIASYAGGSMTLLGQDMATTLAIGGKMTDTLGDQTPRALNQLALQLFNNRERLKEFGVAVFNADGSARNFIDIIRDFQTATAGMSDEQRAATIDLVQGSIAMRGLNAAMNTSAADLDELADKIRNADGAARRWTEVLGQDTLGKIRNLANNIETLAIRVGEHLKPQIDAAIESVANFIKNLKPEKIAEWTSRLAKFGELLVRFWVGAKVAAAVVGVARAVGALKIAFATGIPLAKAFWIAATGGVAALVAFLPEVIALVRRLMSALKLGGSAAPDGIERSAKFQRDLAEHKRNPRRTRAGAESDEQFRQRWARENPDWAEQAERHKSATDAAAAEQAAILDAERDAAANTAAADLPTITVTRDADDIAAAERRAELAAEQRGRQHDAFFARSRAGTAEYGERRREPELGTGAAGETTGLPGSFADAEAEAARLQERADLRAEADRIELERYADHLRERATTEAEFAEEERALRQARLEARMEDDAAERQRQLDEVDARAELLRERRAEQDEADAEIRAEAEAWAAEHQLELNEAELEQLEEFLAQKKAIADAARAQEFQDKLADAAATKTWQQMTDKERLAWLKKIASDELAVLDKGGKAQAAIKKAQKLRELGMSLATDPQEAYATTSKMFGWPLGPALGAAHAALVTAAILKGIKDVSGMATGGWVGGAGGTDSQLRLLSPDEFVAPRRTAEQIIDARAAQMAAARDADDDDPPADDRPLEVTVAIDGDAIAQAIVPEFVRRSAGGF